MHVTINAANNMIVCACKPKAGRRHNGRAYCASGFNLSKELTEMLLGARPFLRQALCHCASFRVIQQWQVLPLSAIFEQISDLFIVDLYC